MSTDRRQFRRFETLLIVEITPHDERSSYFLGITKNVSLEGFIFESQNYDLQKGDILEFRLKHPKNGLSVPVLGEIIWNREMRFECYSGVRFHKFDNASKSRVFELISADSVEQLGQAVPGEGDRSIPKRNGKSEQNNGAGEETIANIIGEAAIHSDTNQAGTNGSRRETAPPIIAAREESPLDVELPERDDIEAAAGNGNSQTAAEGEKNLISQADTPGAAVAHTSSRRKTRGQRTSSPFAITFFFALCIGAALVLLLPGTIRNKYLPPVPAAPFTGDNDALTPNDSPLSQAPPGESQESYDHTADMELIPADTTLPGYDQREDLPGTAGNADHVPIEGSAFHEQHGPVLGSQNPQADTMPLPPLEMNTAASTAPAQQNNVPERGTRDAISRENSAAVVEKKEEDIQKESTSSVKEEKPSAPSTGGSISAAPAVTETEKGLKHATAQDGNVKASEKPRDTPEKKISDEMSQKPHLVQETDVPAVNKPLTGQTVSSSAEPGSGEIHAAEKRYPDPAKRRRAVKPLKTEQPVVESTPVVKPESPEIKKTPPDEIDGKAPVRFADAESARTEKGPDSEAAPAHDEPKSGDSGVDEEPAHKKTSAGKQEMPKIALVLESSQTDAPGSGNHPELSDAYLAKHFSMYVDHFDDNSNNWDLFDIGAASARIEKGFYHIENKKPGGALIVLHYRPFPHDTDFVIETAIKAMDGREKSSFGFLFGARDARDNYSFQVSENRYFSVKNYTRGIPSQLTGGKITDASALNGSLIRLRIVKEDTHIRFFINNVYAAEVSNLVFYGSKIGFIVEGQLHIAVDYTRSYIRRSDDEHLN